jgi:uncharacterized protein
LFIFPPFDKMINQKGKNMASKIMLDLQGAILQADLYDTPDAVELLNMLPVEIEMSRWGEEFYGDCGLKQKLSKGARVEIEAGELAVWPQGSALCIFFGRTPASIDEKPKAASKVNPIGKITSDLSVLKDLGFHITAKISKI